MLKIFLSILTLFSFLIGEISSDKKIVKKMMIVKAESDDNDKSIDINVNASIENDILTLTITKDGEENQYEIPVGNMDAFHALKEELDDLDIDIDLHQLMGGGMEHGKNAMNKAHHMIKKMHRGSGGYLGVGIDELEGQLADYFGAKNGGVLVTEVMDDSPAKKAGIKAGDVIIKVDRVSVKSPKDLKKSIASYEPETKVKLSLIRKNRSKKIAVTLGGAPDADYHFGMDYDFDDDDKDNHNVMMFKFFDEDNLDFKQLMKNIPAPMHHQKDMDQLRKDVKKLQEEIQKLKKDS